MASRKTNAHDRQKHLIIVLVALIAVMTGACSFQLQNFDSEVPAQILSTVGSPPVIDGRPRFRQIFCGLLEEMPAASSETQNCASFIGSIFNRTAPTWPQMTDAGAGPAPWRNLKNRSIHTIFVLRFTVKKRLL